MQVGRPEFWPQLDKFHVILQRNSGQPIDIILELSSHFTLNIWVRVVEVLLESVDQNWILDFATDADQVGLDGLHFKRSGGHVGGRLFLLGPECYHIS